MAEPHFGYGPLVNVQYTRLKPSHQELPTVSRSFFYKSPTSHLHQLQSACPSYIFFDPALKLPSHPIAFQNFISPSLTPEPSEPETSYITPPKTDSLSSDMAKESFDHVDKSFDAIKSIKEKATLNEGDFKDFMKAAEDFVKANEDDCKMVPRSWKKQIWKEIATRFVDAEGNGEKFWHNKRGGFTSSDDLVYPTDKIDITFLACMAIRRESAKHFSNAKRKSTSTADAGETTPTPKKAKLTPKTTEKVAKTPKAAGSTTQKKKNAKKTKKNSQAPKSTEQVVEDESSSDEEESVGAIITGKKMAKNDPFGAARHANDNPAFARENLIGKPGIPPQPEVNVELVNVTQAQTEAAARMDNDLFSFGDLPPAQIAEGLDMDGVAGNLPAEHVVVRRASDRVTVETEFLSRSAIRQSIESPEQGHLAGHHLDRESDTDMLDAAHRVQHSDSLNHITENDGDHAPATNGTRFTLDSPTWGRNTPAESPASPTSSAMKRRADDRAMTPTWHSGTLGNDGSPLNFNQYDTLGYTDQGSGRSSAGTAVADAIAVHGFRSTNTSPVASTSPITDVTFGVSVAGINLPAQLLSMPVNISFAAAMDKISTAFLDNSDANLAAGVRAAKSVTMSWSGGTSPSPAEHQFNINAGMVETLWKVAVKHMVKAMKAEVEDVDGELITMVFS